jgi:type I restriction enzyme S subunit
MYRPSGVPFLGDVPAHWTVQPATTVASVATSTVDKKTYEGQRLVRLCNYTDVYYGDRITDASGFMEATATDSEVQRFTLRRGDVAITKDSETSDDIGISAFVEQDMPGVVFGYHLAVYRPKDYWTGRFIKYLFDSSYVKATLETRTLGVTRVGLSQNTLNYMRWPIPSPREREMIARYLDRETAEIDAFIADQERLIELLAERFESAVTVAVTVGGDIWRVGRLKQSIDQVNNGSWGADPEAEPELGAVRCVRVADFDRWGRRTHRKNETARAYSPAELEGRLLVRGNLILEKSGGGDQSPVGCVVLYDELEPAMYSNFVARIVLRPEFDPRYMTFLHRHLYASGATRRSIKQTTGIQNLDAAAYFGERVLYPPLNEQRAIADDLTQQQRATDSAIADAREAIALSKERRAALISAAVTGKIDVTS